MRTAVCLFLSIYCCAIISAQYADNPCTATSSANTNLRTSEPNDQLSDAFSIEVPVGGSCQYWGKIGDSALGLNDVDFIKVTTAAGEIQTGQVLRVDIDARSLDGSNNLDSYVRIFTPQPIQQGENDDAATPGETLMPDSYLEWTNNGNSPATIYVGVSSSTNKEYNPTSAGTTPGEITVKDYVITISIDAAIDATCTAELPTAITQGGWAAGCAPAADTTTCALTCNNGYAPSAGGTATCTAGVWVNGDQTCPESACSDALVDPGNGNWPAGGCANTAHGGTCQLTCDDGYFVTPGMDIATCTLGQWINGDRVCYDVNECKTVLPCQNGGVCTNTVGDYTCDCSNTDKWFGKDCTEKYIVFDSVSPAYASIAESGEVTFIIMFSQLIAAGDAAARIRLWRNGIEVASHAYGDTTVNEKTMTFPFTLEASGNADDDDLDDDDANEALLYKVSVDANFVTSPTSDGFSFAASPADNWEFTTVGASTIQSPTLTIATTLDVDSYTDAALCAAIQQILYSIPCNYIIITRVAGGSTIIDFKIIGTDQIVDNSVALIRAAETSGELATVLTDAGLGTLVPNVLTTDTSAAEVLPYLDLSLNPNIVGSETTFTALMQLSKTFPRNAKILVHFPTEFTLDQANLQGSLLAADNETAAKMDVGTKTNLFKFTQGDTASIFIADTDPTPSICAGLNLPYCLSDASSEESGCVTSCSQCPNRWLPESGTADCTTVTVTNCGAAGKILCEPTGGTNICVASCSACTGKIWPHDTENRCAAPSDAVCAASTKVYCASTDTCVDTCDDCAKSNLVGNTCQAGTVCNAGEVHCSPANTCLADCTTCAGGKSYADADVGECIVPTQAACQARGKSYCPTGPTCVDDCGDVSAPCGALTGTHPTTSVCVTPDAAGCGGGTDGFLCPVVTIPDHSLFGGAACVSTCGMGNCRDNPHTPIGTGDTCDGGPTGACAAGTYYCATTDTCIADCAVNCVAHPWASDSDKLCVLPSAWNCKVAGKVFCDLLPNDCVDDCTVCGTGAAAKRFLWNGAGTAGDYCVRPSTVVCAAPDWTYCAATPDVCVANCAGCGTGTFQDTVNNQCITPDAATCKAAGMWFCADSSTCVSACVAGMCTGNPIPNSDAAGWWCGPTGAEPVAAGKYLELTVDKGITMPADCTTVKDWVFAVQTLDTLNAIIEWKVMPEWDDACYTDSKAETGVPDGATTLTTSWIQFSPTKSLVAEKFTLWFSGIRIAVAAASDTAVKVKVAARNDGTCEGWAPGSETATLDDDTLSAELYVTRQGEYDICVKHRTNWELTATQFQVEPGTDATSNVYYGHTSCEELVRLRPTYCGCYFSTATTTESENNPLILPSATPTSVVSSVDGLAIRQGCCTNHRGDTPATHAIDATTKWGVCS